MNTDTNTNNRSGVKSIFLLWLIRISILIIILILILIQIPIIGAESKIYFSSDERKGITETGGDEAWGRSHPSLNFIHEIYIIWYTINNDVYHMEV